MSYGPSGTQKPNSRKELPNHVRYLLWVGKVENGLQRIFPERSLFKEKSISCFGGFTFEAKAQENESTKKRDRQFF